MTTELSTAKLSTLQRSILRMAYERHGRGRREKNPTPVDLYYAEILAEHFGFPVSWYDPASHPGSHHFSRSEIGPRTYDAAQASLSRAVRRIEQRGLVTVYNGVISRWTGLALTDHAVRTRPTWTSPNRNGETASTLADLPEC